MEIVSSIVERYKTDPNDITFFEDNEPFLGYETSCVMLNRLVPQITDIDHEVEQAILPDSIQIKVRLTSETGHKRSGLGVVNRNEANTEGKTLSEQQLIYTALSRGLRAAMKIFGIDLMQIHLTGINAPLPFPTNDARQKLLNEVHALGEEVGFINRKKAVTGETVVDKTGWKTFLMHSFGESSCNGLDDDDLRSIAALLRSIKNGAKKAA